MTKIRIGVVGYKGKMGQSIVSCILETPQTTLAGAVSNDKKCEDIGLIFGENIGIESVDSIDKVFLQSDVVIEFTNPHTMHACIEMAIKTKTPLVSGTTGHDYYEMMATCAQQVPILWSANMSIGVNMLSKLVQDAASKLGEEYDIEILEMHHAQKKDAPSGTALMLGEYAAQGLGVDLSSVKSIDRHGLRKKGTIGFATLRGGGIYGEHKVMFITEDEYIELGHVSLTRNLFAKGAVKAALWLYNKENNLYSMQDVLDG